jgi:hypothetical protein
MKGLTYVKNMIEILKELVVGLSVGDMMSAS